MDLEDDFTNLDTIHKRLEYRLNEQQLLVTELKKSMALQNLLHKHGIIFDQKVYLQFKGNPNETIYCHIRNSTTKLLILEVTDIPDILIPEQVKRDLKYSRSRRR